MIVEAIVTGIVGGLLLLALGWLRSDVTKVGDKVDTLGGRVTDVAGAVAHMDGKLEEHLRSH